VVKETGSISIEVPSVTDPRSYERKKLDDGIIWPVNATDIYYLSGKLSGVALSAKKGETVTSVASGSVISTGPYRGFGQVVFIQSLSGYMYVYAGLETIKVRKGDRISFGDAIGTVGNDTLSGKAQLNFIVYNKNTPIDPASAPRG
jgi:septal ring factor EnvC (AmiA/AmiB activator)